MTTIQIHIERKRETKKLKYVPKVLAHFVKSGDNFTLLWLTTAVRSGVILTATRIISRKFSAAYTGEKLRRKLSFFKRNNILAKRLTWPGSPVLDDFKYVSYSVVWWNGEPCEAKISRRLTKFVYPENRCFYASHTSEALLFFLFISSLFTWRQ